MDNILLFIFKPCIRGDDNKEFYTALGIEQSSATTDSIKKAYKKVSLTLHPDKLKQRGIPITAEHKQQFNAAKEAYEVLSDPKRRARYDELGASGLKFIENPRQADPQVLLKNFQKNRKDRLSILLLLLILFAIILVLPVLFCLKCDGRIPRAHWVAIWTPMWIYDALAIVGLYFFFKADPNASAATSSPSSPSSSQSSGDKSGSGHNPSSSNPDSSNRTTDSSNNSGDASAASQSGESSAKGADYDDEQAHPEPVYESMSNLAKLDIFVDRVLFILLQIFVMMRLDKDIQWGWFKVFAPWFLFDIISLLKSIHQGFIAKIEAPYSQANPESGNFEEEGSKQTEYFMKQVGQANARFEVVYYVLRIWLAIFLALQLNHRVHWDWGLVFLPIWLYLIMDLFASRYFNIWGGELLRGLNTTEIETGVDHDPEHIFKYSQGQQLKSIATTNFIGSFGPIIMSILLVCRLEVRFISTFLIIIPIFIGIGCCCCISFCGLICMANMDVGDDAGTLDLKSDAPAGGESSPSQDINTPILGAGAANYGSTQQPASVSQVTITVESGNELDNAPKKGDVDID